jgi:adenine deaminase
MKIDTLFNNATVYNVYTEKWQNIDVAVLDGRILFTGDSGLYNFQTDLVIECGGKPLIPGMIDIHLHIESTLCTPLTFGKSVLRRGVTTIVSEPHEIANVFGVKGLLEMIRVSEGAPIDIFFGVPSSVPSTSSELETTGGTIGPEEAVELMKHHSRVLCLGEVMNYSSLISMERGRTSEMIDAVKNRFPLAAIEGHCPSVKNLDLARLMFSGVDSDHCLQDPEGLVQRFENGMFVELQEKSITEENIAVIKSFHSRGLYSFVTDDVPPDILEKDGHLDYVARKALKAGLALEDIIVATSYAPACRMGMRDRGVIAPGKQADLILLKDDSKEFEIDRIFRKGGEVIESAESTEPGLEFSEKFRHSINLKESDVRDAMFRIGTGNSTGTVQLLSMKKNTSNTYTSESSFTMRISEGYAEWENIEGNLVVVVDRYSGKAGFAQGFLEGCYFRKGAMATSYAHDHHNLLCSGDNRSDMEIAMKWVIRNQGGMCVVSQGHILASIELPVGGILSEKPMAVLAEKLQRVSEAMEKLGFEHRNPVMSFCTLTLPVSPALKISDRGLIRTEDGNIVDMILRID